MPQTLISVLMPLREFTEFTTPAINSVLAQSHTQLELIVIGNTNSEALAAQLPVDERIRVVARHSSGIVGALNTGLPLCSGEYIARMDGDDICHPDRLQSQLAFAQTRPTLSLLAARVSIFSDTNQLGNGNRQYQQWLNAQITPTQIRESCFVESPMPHPSLFAHKDYWSFMQGYRNIDWPEDYDLVLRTWLAGIPMAKPEPVLLQWREHAQRLTRTDSRYSREAFIRAKAWALTQPESQLNLDNGRGVWICGTGRNARYWHDALVDCNAKVLGFVELDSARPRTQKRHLPVIGYTELERVRADALIVSAISNAQAREALSNWFEERNLLACHDFVFGG